jgi:AmmeMemoRadiSam system protein B
MSSPAEVRPPAVAGLFYPAEPEALREAVSGYLEQGRLRRVSGGAAPKALVVPHAGYVYSGPVAGTAYALLEPLREVVRRVVLLGPAHRVPLRGLAFPSVAAFSTPLGQVPIDLEARRLLEGLPQIEIWNAPHAEEHSLEVQLPFLQEALGDFTLAPLVVGDATAQEVAEVVELLWGGPETLILVSSDLSHYYEYDTARQLDRETTRAIEALRPEALGAESACGRVPLRGLLVAAERHALSVRTLDLRSSGDTAGSRDQVVGYGAYAFA